MGLFNWFKRKNKINKKLKIGLVLAGGGAKGVCHIGVLRAFEEEGITFDYIAGTSAGSLIGSAIASGKNSYELEKIANSVKAKDIKSSKIFFVPSKTLKLESLVQDVLGGDIEFKDLKTKFSAVSVCLNNGKEVVFESGKVAKAVCASCCVPGFFSPVLIDGNYYVDGGILNNLPTNVLRNKYCDVIIAVDLGANKKLGTDSTKTLDVLLASYKIMSSFNVANSRQYADILIQPDMNKFKATKLDDVKELINEGYLSAKEKMPKILHLLKTKKRVNLRKINKMNKINEKNHKKQLKQREKFNVYKEKQN